MVIARNSSQGNILMGLPRPFRQNADTAIADVDRGGNLVRGALKTAEFDQHLFRNAAFGPDRRKWVCHGFLSPCERHRPAGLRRQWTRRRPSSGAAVNPKRGPFSAEPLNIHSDEV